MIIHHVCIQTKTYEESLAFYKNILGFELVKESPNFHTRAFNTWLKLGSFMIELQTPKINTTLKNWSSLNGGPVHIGFAVENVKETYENIISKGHLSFKKKNGEDIYKVENGYLFKMIAPEGTQIEIRDMAKI